MLRPRPLPPPPVLVVKNGSKARATTSGAMPVPVSCSASIAYDPMARSSSDRGGSVISTFEVRMVSVPPSGMASRALSAMFRMAASSAAGSTSATPASRLVAVLTRMVAPSVRTSSRTMLSTSALIPTGCGFSWRRREKASRSPVRSWP